MVASDGRRASIGVPDGVEVVDAMGAGDAFAGVLAWELMSDRDPAEAAAVGTTDRRPPIPPSTPSRR